MPLSNNTKVRIVTGNISFFTTVKQIRECIGSHADFNLHCIKALNSLEELRDNNDIKPIGVNCVFGNSYIQLDIL